MFDPVDYLMAQVDPDPVLNHRIGAGVAGHDDWGFRNANVPEATDILAIGDSMTYGVMAKSYEAWPAALAGETGLDVYNAGLGGYGPLHYLHILKTRAPELSPKAVLVMVYPGNDFLDSYNLAHSNETWADYRVSATAPEVDAAALIETQAAPTSLSRKLRQWLAERSVFYRLATQNALFDGVRQREALESSDAAVVFEHLGASMLLKPANRLGFADLADPRLDEGRAIAARALDEIAAFCAEQGIGLHVVVMPVREHLFYKLNPKAFEDVPEMAALDAALTALETELEATLTAAGINHTDLGPVLLEALATERVYPATDGHPNAAGYAVVARHLAPIATELATAN